MTTDELGGRLADLGERLRQLEDGIRDLRARLPVRDRIEPTTTGRDVQVDP